MSSKKSGNSNAASTGRKAPQWEKVFSPWVIGPALTIGFYSLLVQLPSPAAAAQPYFTSSGATYFAVGLFFVGVAVLARKAIGLLLDRRALQLVVIDADSLDGIETIRERAAELVASTEQLPTTIHQTKVVARIHEVCQYIQGCRSSSALEDRLHYLANLALESLTESFAIVRTAVWGIPAAGALGLVLGIISIFHNINPADLDASMPAVVGGLETALAPLAVSLGLSIALMFGKLLVERSESKVLSQIEQFSLLQVAPCFQFDESTSPVVAAPANSTARLLQQTNFLTQEQTTLWQESLENLRAKWCETVEAQQVRFAEELEKGMSLSLNHHAEQLQETREEFLIGFRSVGLELTRITAGLQQMGEESQEAMREGLAETCRTVMQGMADERQEQANHLAAMVAQFETAAIAWREDLSRAADAIVARIKELKETQDALRGIAEQEEALVRLQDTLTQNLQSVRAIEAFEESIHSLNAAVHMLTIRAKAHAA